MIFWRFPPPGPTARSSGSVGEVKLFRALDFVKLFTGVLADFSPDEVILETPAGEKRIPRKAAALIRPVIDMEGVEDVDLSE